MSLSLLWLTSSNRKARQVFLPIVVFGKSEEPGPQKISCSTKLHLLFQAGMLSCSMARTNSSRLPIASHDGAAVGRCVLIYPAFLDGCKRHRRPDALPPASAYSSNLGIVDPGAASKVVSQPFSVAFWIHVYTRVYVYICMCICIYVHVYVAVGYSSMHRASLKSIQWCIQHLAQSWSA